MNPRRKLIARSLLTLAAGMLVFSSWGFPGARLFVMGLPYPQYAALTRASGVPKSGKARLALATRLGAALREPRTLNKADAAAVKAAWGKDSARLLELVRESAD